MKRIIRRRIFKNSKVNEVAIVNVYLDNIIVEYFGIKPGKETYPKRWDYETYFKGNGYREVTTFDLFKTKSWTI